MTERVRYEKLGRAEVREEREEVDGAEEHDDAEHGVRDDIVYGEEKADESGEEDNQRRGALPDRPRQPGTGGTSVRPRRGTPVCMRACAAQSRIEQAADSAGSTTA